MPIKLRETGVEIPASITPAKPYFLDDEPGYFDRTGMISNSWSYPIPSELAEETKPIVYKVATTMTELCIRTHVCKKGCFSADFGETWAIWRADCILVVDKEEAKKIMESEDSDALLE